MQCEITDRQRRERETYDERVRDERVTKVDFDQYSRKKFGPWNPYWRVHDYVHQQFPADRSTLLSYGCGQGVDAIRFARLGYTVAGFDISEASVENARELAVTYGLEQRTRFSVQGAERLDYDSDSFDVVVGMNVLHHLDLKQAVPEMHRVLKPGGCAIFKDSLDTPGRNRIRRSWPIAKLLPLGTKNLVTGEKYRTTADEQPLTADHLDVLRRSFPALRLERFHVLALLAKLFGNRPFWERCDWALFRVLPFVRRLGDNVVVILPKSEEPA